MILQGNKGLIRPALKKQLTEELFCTTLCLNLSHYFVKNTIRIRVYFPSGHWNLTNLSLKYTAVLVWIIHLSCKVILTGCEMVLVIRNV
jgi:hypothetical protein